MEEAKQVSLIEIVRHPERFDKKWVRVTGFAAMEFEHKALYVSDDAYRSADTKSAIWLSTEIDEAKKQLHEAPVLVEGLFDATSLGHLKMFSGTLREIRRFERNR